MDGVQQPPPLVPPNRWPRSSKGVEGRKEKSDGSTGETNGRRLEASQFPRKFALLEGCVRGEELVISRERRGERGEDGRREADGCWSDVFQRDSPARSFFEEHFSELHSYFGSKSSGLIKMGRGLYAPSTRGRPNRGEI